MSIEFLRVIFPVERKILIDGEENGSTNSLLMLPTGVYEISISGSGYTPSKRNVSLTGTSRNKPRTISFKRTNDE